MLGERDLEMLAVRGAAAELRSDPVAVEEPQEIRAEGPLAVKSLLVALGGAVAIGLMILAILVVADGGGRMG